MALEGSGLEAVVALRLEHVTILARCRRVLRFKAGLELKVRHEVCCVWIRKARSDECDGEKSGLVVCVDVRSESESVVE